MVKMELMRWVPWVLVVVFLFLVNGSFSLYTPTDSYLIACGSSQNITFQGRTFVPDSQHSSLVMKTGNSFVASTNSSSAPFPIYQSARVFTEKASYRFEIQQEGRHWVRLYFSPIPNSSHNLTSASLTVVTDDFVLLSNFTFRKYNGSYMFKEYAVNVTSDTLVVTFIPSNGSVAFVNGIEVVSMPNEVFVDQALAVNPPAPFNGLSDLAFETVYRLNMGGPLITSENDTLGRTWLNDRKYLHVNSSVLNVSVNPSSIKYPVAVTPETAPNWVYATAEAMGDANVNDPNFNITWVFNVDPNFSYFIRVHFCDIMSKSLNTLVFNMFINSDIALQSLDLSTMTNDLAVPYFKDFVANASADSNTLTVSVGPDPVADFPNATMNGLEIMKISNSLKSLDGLYSVHSLLPGSHSKKSMVGVIVGSAVGAIAALAIAGLCYCCLVGRKSKSSTQQGHSWLPLPLYGNSLTMTKNSTLSQKSGTASCISLASSNLGRFFNFQEILDATNKFDEKLLLGVGGFGRVYKGTLEDGTNVAVKRGNPRSEQGLAEFRTEIEMLSKLRHRHLVSLIGYCDERSEMILVYEYMANGPLRSHLYGTELPPLSWKQRLEICIGAARGLHYLHTGAAQSIIHRDVKTTNILLDENFVAKVADFGLSKTGPSLDQTHVSTAVKGSFGYLDPEYFRRQQLTEKSDVYSFGVVLMEVLCTRPALNPVLPREQVNIAEWAMTWQKKGMLDQIMDQNLVGKVNPASLKKFGETAEKCLAEHGVDRPSMGDVLWNLEYALQLQETSSALMEPEDNSTNHITGIQLTPPDHFDNSVSMIDGGNSCTDDDAEDAATSAVFSQLVNPRGR
ncbi:receptor-like protein kinase THESEUS 1 [Vigna unguiculata]|uniref:Interleukin-1 receptor-associated kinase 4 n=1 Tax=Vigna unguiculata TaxID=3917 RepID=A0A4D6LE86_VIGUN|nr:receptor-like protein kinase THESEUS 1 [Vigna unguiculata]XP_027910246.1 receptor-like protein kinase THESEUS 1 [Vigna unguiculata]QCD86790.1 interleukin-1 receptor-associated kinase 4 [Vigna unguiculata]